MSDGNRIHPNYRGMIEEIQPRPVIEAVSETQKQLAEMEPGARWAMEAHFRSYSRGGNEGYFTDEALRSKAGGELTEESFWGSAVNTNEFRG